MRFTIFQDSLIGGRRNNQDRVAHSFSKDALLMVLADGMGGHARGEVAAQITATMITELFQEQARGALRRPLTFLTEAFEAAHRAISDYADRHNLLESPRTTCVACVVQHDRAYWAHSGDSRLYMFRKGRLVARTRDHSRVQRLLDAGMLTERDAATHPDRNRIYSCLGGVLPPRIDLSPETPVQEGDTLLLSTDGFWTMHSADQLAAELDLHPITEALPRLLEEACRRGGDEADNASLVGMTWESHGVDAEKENKSISTATMPLDAFTTTFSSTSRKGRLEPGDDITDEEIDRTVAEIQTAIKKYSRT